MKYNDQIKKGIRDIKDIKLSSLEKEDMFGRLDVYIKENPIKDVPVKADIWSIFSMQIQKHRYAYLIVIIILFVATNVSYAAESALPGDILYPVKIVNEKIQSAITFTPKAKVNLEEKRVIKRLDEAEALIKKGEFKDDKHNQIEKEIDKSFKTIKDNKKKNDKDDNFDDKLNSHIEEIKKVDNEKNKDNIKKLEDKVKGHLNNKKDK